MTNGLPLKRRRAFPSLRRALRVLPFLGIATSPAWAEDLLFTLNTNEDVQVTGTPQLKLEIGGDEKRADYVAASSGVRQLIFRYTVEPRDFDANGITILPELVYPSGASIRDAAGNDVTVGFAQSDVAGIKIQSYSVQIAAVQDEAGLLKFSIINAPEGASYSYRITSSASSANPGFTAPVAITANPQPVSADISALPVGTYTVTIRVSKEGADGDPVTGQFDGGAPTGYGVTFLTANKTASVFRIDNGELNARYDYTITSAAGGTPVSGFGTISSASQVISDANLTSLNDGLLTISVTLTDGQTNVGSAVTATITKDTVEPTITTVTAPADKTYVYTAP